MTYELSAGRHAYLTVAAGAVEVNGLQLNSRDGAAATDETILTFKAHSDAEIVLVDAL